MNAAQIKRMTDYTGGDDTGTFRGPWTMGTAEVFDVTAFGDAQRKYIEGLPFDSSIELSGAHPYRHVGPLYTCVYCGRISQVLEVCQGCGSAPTKETRK